MEIAGAREIVAQEAREAIRLDPAVLPDVAQLLHGPGGWSPTSCGTPCPGCEDARGPGADAEGQGRVSTAATALEDAIAIASTSSEKVSVHLAHARFLLRRGSAELALGQARQALALAPKDAEAFVVLAEAYEANGL